MSPIMLDQSNNYTETGAGKNEQESDSQENTSRNQGNTSNENGKHNNRRQIYIWTTNDISSNFYF